MSATEGSTQTRRSTRSLDHQSFGRGSDEIKMKEEDREIDLEDKPQPSPRVLSGATADRSAKSDLLDENPMVKTKLAKAKPYTLVSRSPDIKTRKTTKKPARSARKKKKAPRSDGKDHRVGKPIGSKIAVMEEYDREMAQIAVSKIESVTQRWECAKWQCYYSVAKSLFKISYDDR